jgi:hypothetical protein
MTPGPLSADDIRRLFEELASELDRNGQRAEVFLVGGAAIALCDRPGRAIGSDPGQPLRPVSAPGRNRTCDPLLRSYPALSAVATSQNARHDGAS